MRYVIDDHGPGYSDRLRTLISFFVMARALRGEPLLGVRAGGELGAVATVSSRSNGEAPQELAQKRDRVHRISVGNGGSTGVPLTTEDSINVPFYERMGYEIVGRAEIAPGLQSWGMFRRD